jgi:hypothetical protein
MGCSVLWTSTLSNGINVWRLKVTVALEMQLPSQLAVPVEQVKEVIGSWDEHRCGSGL